MSLQSRIERLERQVGKTVTDDGDDDVGWLLTLLSDWPAETLCGSQWDRHVERVPPYRLLPERAEAIREECRRLAEKVRAGEVPANEDSMFTEMPFACLRALDALFTAQETAEKARPRGTVDRSGK